MFGVYGRGVYAQRDRQEKRGKEGPEWCGGKEEGRQSGRKKKPLYDLWELTFMLSKAYCNLKGTRGKAPTGRRVFFFARRLRGCAGARQFTSGLNEMR